MIAVTGATGFVGQHVVRALADAGHEVRALSRRDVSPSELAVAEVVRGDLLDDAAVARLVAGADAVVNIAGSLHGDRLDDANVAGARAVATAAARAGVARFVHVSSGGVYGDGDSERLHAESDPIAPRSAYERSKAAGESAVREALAPGTALTILRPQGVFGPGREATAAFLRDVARRRLWLHGPARVIVHPTYVGDVAQAVARAVARDAGGVYNVGGERALDLREYVALVAHALGRTARQATAPGWLVRPAAAAAAAVLPRGSGPALRAGRLRRRFLNRGLDLARSRRELGFVPAPFADALDRTVRWARDAGVV